MRFFLVFHILLLPVLLTSQNSFPEFGKASYYSDNLVGKLTASGENYTHNALTAAHRSLPFGTKIKVTNLDNGKSINVRINDRGPYVEDRIIDVSKKAAKILDFIEEGITEVKIELSESGYSESIRKKESKGNIQYSYYKVDSKPVKPGKYGIQVASYSDSGNVLKSISDFQTNYNLPLIVQESADEAGRKYRIIVGSFSTKNEALNVLNNIKSKYTDCFILNLPE